MRQGSCGRAARNLNVQQEPQTCKKSLRHATAGASRVGYDVSACSKERVACSKGCVACNREQGEHGRGRGTVGPRTVQAACKRMYSGVGVWGTTMGVGLWVLLTHGAVGVVSELMVSRVRTVQR